MPPKTSEPSQEGIAELAREITHDFERHLAATQDTLKVFEDYYGLKGQEALLSDLRYKGLLEKVEGLVRKFLESEWVDISQIASAQARRHTEIGIGSRLFVREYLYLLDLVASRVSEPSFERFKENAFKFMLEALGLHDAFIQEARAREQERNRQLEAFISQSGSVLKGASQGDFNQRIPLEQISEEFRQIGENLNILLQGVQDTKKRLENQLLFTNHILDLSIDAILVLKEDGTILNAGVSAKRLLGKEELEGASYFKFVPSEEREAQRQDLLEIIQKGHGTCPGHEYRLIRADGAAFNAMVFHGEIKDPSTDEHLALMFVRDITELKKSQQNMQKPRRH